jgi:tetratricopeptide (TPR) repeat protein|tara:strand:- start:3006 stop:3434 length:429 start_codon:yes stop_codon:yes gene_type:complete
MKKIFFLVKIILIFFLFSKSLHASSSTHFDEGERLFDKKKFDESKIFFERDLIFNPKSAKSYLYLAKIFNIKENADEENINLKNVLLLEPNNDEAIYMLALIKINLSDYKKANELIEKFDLVCKKLCDKSEELKKKIDKLKP